MTDVNFQKYCFDRHDIFANQKYGGDLPYSFHLKAVMGEGFKFAYLLDPIDRFTVINGCAGHDLIEDTRLTYNDLVGVAGQKVADIVYACTEEKGRNREERHSEKFYLQLATNDLAIFVKLCDIIANVKYSILTNSTMLDKYRKEYGKVYDYLYTPKYKEMFDYLKKLLEL